jgi:hypothetical protein
MRTEVLDPNIDLQWRDYWRKLAERAEGASCFTLPSYFEVWHSLLSADTIVRILTVHDKDEVIGLMPVMRAAVWRGPACVPRHDYAPSDRSTILGGAPRPFRLRQISPVVSVPAVYSAPAPLCLPGAEQAVTSALAKMLVCMPRWDVIVIPAFAGAQQFYWLKSFETLRLEPTLHKLHRVIQRLAHVRPFGQIVAAAQSRKFRQNVRRAQAAASELAMTFTVREGRDAVTASFDLVARIAAASWKHKGRRETGVHIPYDGRQRAFIEALISDGDFSATPVLGIASTRGIPVCVLLGAVYAQTFTTLLLFRDQSCAEASPGLLLVGTMIDWAASHGLTRIDLNATHEWVRHISDERASLDNIVVFAPTLAGRTYRYIARTAQAFR